MTPLEWHRVGLPKPCFVHRHKVRWYGQVGRSMAARVRVSLMAGQTVHIDSADNKSINLQCGDHAETLTLVDTNKLVAAGVAQ